MDKRHQNPNDKDMEEPAPPGIPEAEYKLSESPTKPVDPPKLVVSSKGIENAKKRLRAFSIQKRTPLTPAAAPKPSGSGTSAVFIGRLNSIKPSRFAPIEEEPKKPPRPPKLGSGRKFLQDEIQKRSAIWDMESPDFKNNVIKKRNWEEMVEFFCDAGDSLEKKKLLDSYSEIQKKTLSEIEDMKRKMELVDLGIPLGLICPGIVDDRAMPTKAMPPIKTLLDPAKVDEIIREAKKAQQEGREYKFDYRKLLPDYDNPFQRKREDSNSEDKSEKPDSKLHEKDKRKDSQKIESKKYEDKHSGKPKGTHGDKSSRSRDCKSKEPAETDSVIEANLKDYLVCDSWSLDEKTNSSSPKVGDKSLKKSSHSKESQKVLHDQKVKDISLSERVKDSPLLAKSKDSPYRPKDSPLLAKAKGSPLLTKEKEKNPSLLVPNKVKLQPVIDSFKFEIDEPIDDDVIDMYDVEDIPLPPVKKTEIPANMKILDEIEDTSCDGMDDDTFMESVINEMKHDNIDDDFTHEKSLVEYDISPTKDEDSKDFPDGSVTPELDDSMRELQTSRHSNYSDGYRSTESGYKSTESGYKSNATESGYRSTESGYKSNATESGYKSTESGYKSKTTESGYKSTESGYKSNATESGYRSTESGYKSNATESGYKSTESGYKSKTNESGYKSTESGYKSNAIESGYKSTESGYKSNATESGYKSTESGYKSNEKVYTSEKRSKSDKRSKTKSESKRDKSKEKPPISPESDCRSSRYSMENEDDTISMKMSKYTLDSLETWSFVLKFCQPLLFRHDKNKCYRETRTTPKLWFAAAPKYCACVDDRQIVYAELQECKMALVDRVYGCDQISDGPSPSTRPWYPRNQLCLVETTAVPIASDWEEDCVEVKQGHVKVKGEKFEVKCKEEGKTRRSMTPLLNEDKSVDLEYQKFMEAVWPSVIDGKPPTPRCTPPAPLNPGGAKEAGGVNESGGADRVGAINEADRKTKKVKLSSDGWSQESEVEEEPVAKKPKTEKKDKTRKRKHSVSTISASDSEELPKKKKKAIKKKEKKKLKSKLAKRKRTEKKRLKKLKEKQKKKKANESDDNEEIEIKKEHKKSKKKKQPKLKKKDQKKKKSKKVSSTSDDTSTGSSSSETSSDTESVIAKKKTKKEQKHKKKDKKRKKSTSESTQSETDIFDVNILNNIKKELTDEERNSKKIPREIINVNQLQNDFVGNIHIKEEKIDTSYIETEVTNQKEPSPQPEQTENVANLNDIPLPQKIPVLDENLSQSSSQASQESICSVKEFEKDESHLRPSSQNSNYSFNDVIANRSELYTKAIETEVDCEKFGEVYEPENYDVYEQMALEYQNDVANQQQSSGSSPSVEQKIETVVRRREGEIKCDWRPTEQNVHPPPAAVTEPKRPSRWGLKPGEVNIVLTGGTEQHFKQNTEQHFKQNTEPVYQIESLANRNTDNNSMSYDEAYMHTYGASDKLQYGDCFAEVSGSSPSNEEEAPSTRSALDDRIDKALRISVLGEVARDPDDDKENKDRNKTNKSRNKSVSFADGYKPGQDSDVEDPPKKKKRVSKRGCAWPCPASHPDHVPLWDALPPPPPPTEPYPTTIPRQQQHRMPPMPLLGPRMPPPLNQLNQIMPPHHHAPIKYEPTIPGFMPPEPPPGLITFN